jgi:hypothetical protein
MAFTRPIALAVIALAVVFGFTIGACSSGEDGADGAMGPAGPAGPVGPPGAPGARGSDGLPGTLPDAGPTGACTQPCHTFNGVVEQWRFSTHSHPQNREIGGGSCGNCHALDGIQQRLSGNGAVLPDSGAPPGVTKGQINYRAATGAVTEMGYAGATAIGRIHCSTCHDFNETTDPHVTGTYTKGQAPIRVAGGVSDTVLLEKTTDAGATEPTGTPVSYRSGNLCVYCHKSRRDVTFFIGDTNTMSSFRWGPHSGPQADLFSGIGGFHFGSARYTPSAHVTIADACVSCHMQPVAANANVPDHTMKPTVAYCKTCHTTYTGTDFNIQGGRSIVANGLAELQRLLNEANLLTRATAQPFPALSEEELADRQFQRDYVRQRGGPNNTNLVIDRPTAGALYNYLVIARGKDLGVHNPTYTKQLLWDSIRHMRTALGQCTTAPPKTPCDPSSLPSRPE